jgi:colicin import membrane protein
MATSAQKQAQYAQYSRTVQEMGRIAADAVQEAKKEAAAAKSARDKAGKAALPSAANQAAKEARSHAESARKHAKNAEAASKAAASALSSIGDPATKVLPETLAARAGEDAKIAKGYADRAEQAAEEAEAIATSE